MLTQSDLSQFTGTLDKTRFGLCRWAIATEGVMHLAKEAKAYWLLDAIASYLPDARKGKHGDDFRWMSFWTLTKTGDTTATLRGDDGNKNVKVTQEIEYTDIWQNFDGDQLVIWAQDDEQYVTLMLPSEY